MDLYGELAWRGLVYDATDGARDELARGPVTGYIGFDPTAPSLHVGSLLMMVALSHLQRHGHTAIAVVGGGTGLIGDPSGKATERLLLTPERVAENVAGIRAQLARFLDFDSTTNPARLVDNGEWLTRLGAIDFMRDVGKHFSVNVMLAKDSVKRRTEGDEGMSFTEFSYSLLQAYDYLVLHDRFTCTLQMGGSDQWGNIVAGMDLIRRVRGVKAHGLVMPLITTAAGTKFGKTEAGAIWLDPQLTTPYDFYQFWLNVDDRDAVRYLKFFTFLDAARIAELEAATGREPHARHAQRELAREVTRLVHGDAAVRGAEANSSVLFAPTIDIEQLRSVEHKVLIARARFTAGIPIVQLLTLANLTASNGEATRLIRSGGITLNRERVTDERLVLTVAATLDGELLVLGKGKKQLTVVQLTDA